MHKVKVEPGESEITKEESLQENISYGVFWIRKDNLNKMTLFAGYFESYQDAYEESIKLRWNPSCDAAFIIERTEHFEIVLRTF